MIPDELEPIFSLEVNTNPAGFVNKVWYNEEVNTDLLSCGMNIYQAIAEIVLQFLFVMCDEHYIPIDKMMQEALVRRQVENAVKDAREGSGQET